MMSDIRQALSSSADFIRNALLTAFRAGSSVPDFIASVRCHKERWANHTSDFEIPHELKGKLADIGSRMSPMKVVVITEDWCPDSVMNVPVLEHTAKAVGNMKVRVVRRADFAQLAKEFPGRDGHSHIPTIVFFDEKGNCAHWSERCDHDHEWFTNFVAAHPIPALRFVNGIPSDEVEAWMTARMDAEMPAYLTTFCWDTIAEWMTLLSRFGRGETASLRGYCGKQQTSSLRRNCSKKWNLGTLVRFADGLCQC